MVAASAPAEETSAAMSSAVSLAAYQNGAQFFLLPLFIHQRFFFPSAWISIYIYIYKVKKAAYSAKS